MRIAYLVSEYPATSHTFIRREIGALRSQGVSIATFSVRRPAPSAVSSIADEVSVKETFYILPPSSVSLFLSHCAAVFKRPARYFNTLGLALQHRVPGLSSLVWSLFYFAEAIVLVQQLERKRIDHLHTHFANSGATVGLLASYYLRMPWSLTLHGISETDYPAGLLLGAKIEAAHFVVCASHFLRAQAMRTVLPKYWPKLMIVHCALDLKQIPKRAAPNQNRTPVLICVGRLSPEKGHVGLLQAFSKVLESGLQADLILVGDGPERARIEQTIEDLNLRSNVALKGRLSEADTLSQIANSDVLVLSSFMEGLPVVLMEAMAMELPVIASRVAGVPELVTDNEHGLLFCPTDWEELAEKIKLLLGDPQLRRQLGRAARAKIELAFEIEHAVQPLIARFSEK